MKDSFYMYVSYKKYVCYSCRNTIHVQLRLINLITGETWDFYTHPSSTEFSFPPRLTSPSGMRYCVEIRNFTTEVLGLYKSVVPMEKLYFKSKC